MSVVKNLKGILSYQGALPLGGEIFHIRCCAHILNILVQDGLKEIQDIVTDVRESVKHIAASEIRITTFRDIAKKLQSPAKKLVLDCSTRWNSTYHMMSTALELKDVFPLYKERDALYHSLPSEEDWENVKLVCDFLELFNDVTTMISGSAYPTANLFLPELCDIKLLLKKTLDSSHASMRSMASRMLKKFDKYWGEANLVVSLAAVLDPRNKFKMLEAYFPDLYTPADSELNVRMVRDKLYKLFHEFVEDFRARNVASAASDVQTAPSASTSTGNSKKRSGRARFDSMVQNVNFASTMKSELDIYLEEGLYVHTEESIFDIIGWWKEQRIRFKVLSRMACDIMEIPVTSVAFEATFSAGGRVIDPQRAWDKRQLRLYFALMIG
ncbi:unnamed protein product [Linum trigynum]|uniref:Zinc finger BED domain-containing protein RICESLEEPER 2-like n=1 Tax=Linum trigynum TaxID=586398 RepID=A0AAV2CFN7_9ROSI